MHSSPGTWESGRVRRQIRRWKVAKNETIIDIGRRMGYRLPNLAPVQGRRPGDSGWRGECGSRGSGLVTSALGRLGQDTPGRHHDRAAGAISLDWDRKARVMPASDAGKPARRLRVKMRCDALRLSNHRDGRSEQVPGSRVARAERWRSVAAASAVVERREASALREGAPHRKMRRLRNSAFRRSAFLFSFVARMSGAKSGSGLSSGTSVPGYRCAHPGYIRA